MRTINAVLNYFAFYKTLISVVSHFLVRAAVLLRALITQMTIFNQDMLHLDSYHCPFNNFFKFYVDFTNGRGC